MTSHAKPPLKHLPVRKPLAIPSESQVAALPVSPVAHTGATGFIKFTRHIVGTTAHHAPSGTKSWLDYAQTHLQKYGIESSLCPCSRYTAAAIDEPHNLAGKSVGAHVCVTLPSGEVFLGVTPTCSSCNTSQAILNEPFSLVTVASRACGTFAGTINPNTGAASSKRVSVPELKKITMLHVTAEGVTVELSKLALGGVIRDGTPREMPQSVADNDDYMLNLGVFSRNRLGRNRAVSEAPRIPHVPVVIHVSPLEKTYAIMELSKGTG